MADVLKKLKYQVDKDSLEKIYFSFIRPKLEYASHIWDNCNKADNKALEDFQMSIARIVTGARKGTSHDLIDKELNWPSLNDRRRGMKLKNFIKIINNETPQYLQSLIPQRVGDVRPESRYQDNFCPVRSRTETFRNSFIPSAVRFWNSLSVTDRNVSYVKSLMSNTYKPLLYYGARKNNIKHAQLRMRCSKLNFHLFSLHVRDSPACPCGHNCEDTNHYLLYCPLFFQQRNAMFNSIRNIATNIDISCNLLLFGSDKLNATVNENIFDIVHNYIDETGRL